MQAIPTFEPETIMDFRKIYEEHKESVLYQALFGNATEKAFAKTILTVAGVDLPCQK